MNNRKNFTRVTAALVLSAMSTMTFPTELVSITAYAETGEVKTGSYTPVADAYVSSTNLPSQGIVNIDKRYGYIDKTNLCVGTPLAQQTYMRFDLSNTDDNIANMADDIIDVSLTLYSNDKTGDGTGTIDVYNIPDVSWDEKELTYNNASYAYNKTGEPPANKAGISPLGTYSDLTESDKVASIEITQGKYVGEYEIKSEALTEYVKQQLKYGNNQLGLLFHPKNDGIIRPYFNSKDAESNKPTLEIKYGKVPKAENLEISKTKLVEGQDVFAVYDYVNGEEQDSEFVWYKSDSKDGEWEEVKRGTTTSATSKENTVLNLNSDLKGKYIKCEITPKDSQGQTGLTVETDAMQVVENAPYEISVEPSADTFGQFDGDKGDVVTHDLIGDDGKTPEKNLLRVADTRRYAFLKFDMPDVIPELVEKAELKINKLYSSWNGGTMFAREVKDNTWTEETLTYNNGKKLINFENEISKLALTQGDKEDDKFLDVTSYIKDELETEKETSIALSATGNIYFLNSRHVSDASQRPALVLNVKQLSGIPAAPSIKEIKITEGTLSQAGYSISADYKFVDANADTEVKTKYRWLRADTKDGEYTEVASGTTTSETAAYDTRYQINDDDYGKFLKLELTPNTASDSEATGQTVITEAYEVLTVDRIHVLQAYDALEIKADTETDLDLPKSGLNGTSISWSSNMPDVIDNDGKVIRPSWNDYDKVVTLTATISKNNESVTKEFEVTVKKLELTDGEIVQGDYDDLTVAQTVKYDIYLPTSMPRGSSVTWKSSDESVISSTGKVTRKEQDSTVTLTATLTKGSEKMTKEFTVTVPATAGVAEITDAKVTGDSQIGSTISAEYNYDGEVDIRWMRSATANGRYYQIDGAYGKTYTLTEDDNNHYIRYEIVPKTGGMTVQSKAFAGPVLKQDITEPVGLSDIGIAVPRKMFLLKKDSAHQSEQLNLYYQNVFYGKTNNLKLTGAASSDKVKNYVPYLAINSTGELNTIDVTVKAVTLAGNTVLSKQISLDEVGRENNSDIFVMNIGDQNTNGSGYVAQLETTLDNVVTLGTRTFDDGNINMEGREGWTVKDYISPGSPFVFPTGIDADKYYGDVHFWRNVVNDGGKEYDGFAKLATGWKTSASEMMYDENGYPKNPQEGYVVYNSMNGKFEIYEGNAWIEMSEQPDWELSFTKYMQKNAAAMTYKYMPATPDVVSILLGNNDFVNVSNSAQYDEYINGIEQLINSIHEYDPSIKVIVNMPPTGPDYTNENNEYSGSAEAYKSNMINAGWAILNKWDNTESVNSGILVNSMAVAVDPYVGYSSSEKNANAYTEDKTMFYDDVTMPNDIGQKQMGDTLAAAVQAIRNENGKIPNISDAVISDKIGDIDSWDKVDTDVSIALPSHVYMLSDGDAEKTNQHNLFFENFIQGYSDNLKIDVNAPFGRTYDGFWRLETDQADVPEYSISNGSFPFEIQLKDSKYNTLAEKTVDFEVVPIENTDPITIMPVGDSITRGYYYVQHLQNTLPNVKSVGTRTYDDGEIVTEGRGGWKYDYYLANDKQKPASPFIFPEGVSGYDYKGNVQHFKKVIADRLLEGMAVYDTEGFEKLAAGWSESKGVEKVQDDGIKVYKYDYLYSEETGYPLNPEEGNVVYDTDYKSEEFREYKNGEWVAMSPQPKWETSLEKYFQFSENAFKDEEGNFKEPDVISILLGTNDVYSVSSVPAFIEQGKQFVDMILKYNEDHGTDIKVIVNAPPSVGYQSNDRSRQYRYIEAAEQLIASFDTPEYAEKGVYVTNMSSVLDTVNAYAYNKIPFNKYTEDFWKYPNNDVHPTQAGHGQMGDMLAAVVQKIRNEKAGIEEGPRYENTTIGTETGVDKTFAAVTDSVYLLDGAEHDMYFNNMLGAASEDVKVEASANKGDVYDRFVKFNEVSDDERVDVLVKDAGNRVLIDKSVQVEKVDKTQYDDTGYLVIGDELSANGEYVSKISETLPWFKSVGTQEVNGIKTESHAGFTSYDFVSNVESPFVFDGKFDFEKYIEANKSEFEVIPKIVNIHLGNSEFLNKSAVGTGVEEYISNIQTMIDSIKSYDSDIQVIVTTPSVGAEMNGWKFDDNAVDYGRYRLNMQLAAQAVIDKWDNDESGVTVCPAHMFLDEKYGFDRVEENIFLYTGVGGDVSEGGGSTPVEDEDPNTIFRVTNSFTPNDAGFSQLANIIGSYLQKSASDIYGGTDVPDIKLSIEKNGTDVVAKVSEETSAGILAIAVYNNSGHLIKISQIDLSENTSNECSVSLTDIENTDGYFAKAFLWNNLADIRPIVDSSKINL